MRRAYLLWRYRGKGESFVDPARLKAQLSVEGLCDTAEGYWARITDPTYVMAKPFASPAEAPQLLHNLGLLLDGLRLGGGMTVIEFGAGSCWLARLLAGMGMETVSVDPSDSALNIGRCLFREHPPIGFAFGEPRFVRFDGRRLPLDDASCDRIAVFDAFHHVPNQEEVFREFYRVLRPGGILGFSEPGMFHSLSPQSQHEMRSFSVLEDDLSPDGLWQMARDAGFTHGYAKLALEAGIDVSLPEHGRIVYFGWIPRWIKNRLILSMQNQNIMFFTKGDYLPDSRRAVGLMHEMTVGAGEIVASPGESLAIEVTVANTGSARWLCGNARDLGVVRLGAHLLDGEGRLLDRDFLRVSLPHDVMPGEMVTLRADCSLPQPGSHSLEFDMVAEQVTWFAEHGAGTVKVSIV